MEVRYALASLPPKKRPPVDAEHSRKRRHSIRGPNRLFKKIDKIARSARHLITSSPPPAPSQQSSLGDGEVERRPQRSHPQSQRPRNDLCGRKRMPGAIIRCSGNQPSNILWRTSPRALARKRLHTLLAAHAPSRVRNSFRGPEGQKNPERIARRPARPTGRISAAAPRWGAPPSPSARHLARTCSASTVPRPDFGERLSSGHRAVDSGSNSGSTEEAARKKCHASCRKNYTDFPHVDVVQWSRAVRAEDLTSRLMHVFL